MKRLLIFAALALHVSGVKAGECERAWAGYNKQIAEDAAVTNWGPGVKETNDKLNERMKANINKGCEPGGFYDRPFERSRRCVRPIQILKAADDFPCWSINRLRVVQPAAKPRHVPGQQD